MERYRDMWVRGAADVQIVDECTWHYDPGFDLLDQPSLIIDIGAHIGGFVAEAKRRFSHVRIVAVEPDLKNFLLLKRNAAYDDVTLRFGACGVWNGLLWKHFSGSQVQINSQPSALRFLGDTFSLAELVTERVDLIKFDCEGAEYNIFQNTTARTWERVRAIVGEYHGPRDAFDTRAMPFLQEYFEISFYPPYNPHVGFFLGINRNAH